MGRSTQSRKEQDYSKRYFALADASDTGILLLEVDVSVACARFSKLLFLDLTALGGRGARALALYRSFARPLSIGCSNNHPGKGASGPPPSGPQPRKGSSTGETLCCVFRP